MRSDVACPALLAAERRDDVRLHEHPAVGDRRCDERHLDGRDQRLRLAICGVRELDGILEAATERAATVRQLRPADRQVERDRLPEAQSLGHRRERADGQTLIQPCS